MRGGSPSRVRSVDRRRSTGTSNLGSPPPHPALITPPPHPVHPTAPGTAGTAVPPTTPNPATPPPTRPAPTRPPMSPLTRHCLPVTPPDRPVRCHTVKLMQNACRPARTSRLGHNGLAASSKRIVSSILLKHIADLIGGRLSLAASRL